MCNIELTVIAGDGQQGHQDGDGLHSQFYCPYGICISYDDKIYVTDTHNHCVRMIHQEKVTTVAGTGSPGLQDGPVMDAQFNGPRGICISNDEIIYVADYNNHGIREIDHGQVKMIAGTGRSGFQDGIATSAKFARPNDICISQDQRIYVADTLNHRIRMIYKGKVRTIAGNGEQGFEDGHWFHSKFNRPTGLCVSKLGIIYVVSDHRRIRSISNDRVTTIAGNGKPGCYIGRNLLSSSFNCSGPICISDDGDQIYFFNKGDELNMIQYGEIITIIGKRRLYQGNATLNLAGAMCISQQGHIYVTDYHHHRVLKITKDCIALTTTSFSLLNMLKVDSLLDYTVVLNQHKFATARKFIAVRCPQLLDVDCLKLIQDANIDFKPLEFFMAYLYSNLLLNPSTQECMIEYQYEADLKLWVEFLFVMDVFNMDHPQLQNLFYQKQHYLVHASTDEKITHLMHLLTKLYTFKKQLDENLITRGNKRLSTHITCSYHRLLNDLKNTTDVISTDHLAILNSQLSQHDADIVMKAFMSDENNLDSTTLDQPCINNDQEQSCDLIELSRLAFQTTDLCDVSTQFSPIQSDHWMTWTRPDFIIKLSDESQSYHVHQLILCARWRYFALLLQSGCMEAQHGEMTLSDDWTASRLQHFMHYIYLNVCTLDDPQDAKWLLQSALLYTITTKEPKPITSSRQSQEDRDIDNFISPGFELLYKHCIQLLQIDQPWSIDNIIPIYGLLKELNFTSRLSHAAMFISNNFNRISKNQFAREQMICSLNAEEIVNLMAYQYESSITPWLEHEE